ncbi:hypothetical protein GLYMA_11G221300v4 [Glycine max]|uniref:Uncharacterized protein n=1 Tax=Glycine max TaxID=3847 RepID=K7LRK8_SOYBN|nr:hypothetical protein JHK87_031979 [Glycine soja]KAG4989729.1 hypothetical protein JHK85_032712 [Glycine max]KAG4995315.1 hypothetical protein JHK86_032142 [Glycine max]KAG5146735.1 hypothetical protein JHK84_032278 [Glycine max]KAH1160298.1 hypothetical protein GYH30_031869 [Glycine max]
MSKNTLHTGRTHPTTEKERADAQIYYLIMRNEGTSTVKGALSLLIIMFELRNKSSEIIF